MSPILGYAVCCLAAASAFAICVANIRLTEARRLRDSAWRFHTQALVDREAADARHDAARRMMGLATERMNAVARRTQ